MDELIRQYTWEILRRRNAALELMCERMLVDPLGRGVAIIEQNNGTTHFILAAGVLFGHIFEFPSPDSYQNWIALGCPT